MSPHDLTDYEKEVVLFLAERWESPDQDLKEILVKEFPHYSKDSAALVNQVIEQFIANNWLENYHPGVRVKSAIREVAHELRNPPLIDYWASLATWFRSKWWSVPVMLVVVGLPAIYGYYEMIHKLCEWFGILNKGFLS
jgi:hypothetical protein